MNTSPGPQRATRLVHLLLTILLVVARLATALFVAGLVLVGTGGKLTIDLNAWVIEPTAEERAALDLPTGTTSFNSDGGTVFLDRQHATITPAEGRRAVQSTVMAMLIVWGVTWWVVLANVRAVVASTRDGDAFSPANGNRLLAAGLALMALPLASIASNALLSAQVDALGLNGPRLEIDTGDYDLPWLVAGLILIVLSSVFRYGTALAELEKATV